MATVQQTRNLSAPAIYVSGVLMKIIPNSGEMGLGNGSTPRAVSAGGGAIEIVNGIDVGRLMSRVKFEIAATAENVEIVRGWINAANNGASETIEISELGNQYSFDQMFLKGEMNAAMRSDGNITCDWEGRYVA